jgi:HK97 family phage portal protein
MKSQNYGSIKMQLNIPFLQEEIVTGHYRPGAEAKDAFSRVALIYRAVKLRCNTITRVPVYFYGGGDKELEQYPFEDQLPFSDWLWLNEAALLLAGASYTVRLRNQYAREKGLQWLNPFTVKPELVNGKIIFTQTIEGQQKGKWGEDEIIYLREFSPLDDVGPGISATSVAAEDGRTLRAVSQFLGNFFESGAMPVTLLTIKGLPAAAPQGAPAGERERIERFFKKMMTKVKNAFRVLAVGNDVDLKTITPLLNSFDIDKLDTHSIAGVAWAFDIPKSVLTSDSANYATATTEYEIYLRNTIIPRCNFFEAKFNKFLSDYDCRIEFAPEEMLENQENEWRRAQSLKSMTDAGLPILAALDILGYNLSDKAQAVLNEALAKPAPPPPAPVVVSPVQTNPANEVDQTTTDTNAVTVRMVEDLSKWMRKSLKSLEGGKLPLVDFESEAIPDDMKMKVNTGLAKATTPHEIKEAFEEVKPFRASVHHGDNDMDVEIKMRVPVPDREIQHITVNVPEQKSPDVQVTNEVKVEKPDPVQVTVNVPKADPVVVNVPAPQVTVNMPEQTAPAVNVTVERPPLETEIQYNRDGTIKRVVSK